MVHAWMEEMKKMKKTEKHLTYIIEQAQEHATRSTISNTLATH
jgi:hypothetical protein